MLLLALVLLGTAIALAVLCPRVLTAGRWHLFHPRAALTVWFGSFGVGIATALAGIALASSRSSRCGTPSRTPPA